MPIDLVLLQSFSFNRCLMNGRVREILSGLMGGVTPEGPVWRWRWDSDLRRRPLSLGVVINPLGFRGRMPGGTTFAIPPARCPFTTSVEAIQAKAKLGLDS